jgi:hypothetical protein
MDVVMSQAAEDAPSQARHHAGSDMARSRLRLPSDKLRVRQPIGRLVLVAIAYFTEAFLRIAYRQDCVLQLCALYM